ncbi:GNAT family N-acetyltransferase [Terriglobus aquaticus]|uniref:GNAT family N-acetyltransferase n=1 Tax=Terriglobus aquaticus TaxID=940139 RepID=A0ABW9KQW6_9BACT|nr:GNAT family N-acyltransferase [Terriglobus aquaticus]
MSFLPVVLPAPTPALPFLRPQELARTARFQARLALTEDDRRAVYRLRFVVFNLEMHEGLESAYLDGLDTDAYDDVCDHLLVEDTTTGQVVGTYRMQSGATAMRHHGYYSEQEFDFSPYESKRSQILELGRACVHREFRNSDVLNLLWKGVVRYSRERGLRYLIGCCSLSSQVPAEGRAVAELLQAYTVEPEWQTRPTAQCALPGEPKEAETDENGATTEGEVPRLLRAYLAMGARICAAPAIDYAFGTIDFLTLLDLEMLHPRVLRRFL